MSGSHRLLALCLGVVIAGCAQDGATPADTEATAATPTAQPDATAADGTAAATGPDSQTDDATVADGGSPADAPAAAGFDIEALPMSSQALGDFPFFSLPEGHRAVQTKTLDFGEAAFWNGVDLTRVEGRVYATGIRRDSRSGGDFSDLTVVRNLEAVVLAAGGTEVSAGQVPPELRDAAADAMRAYRIEAKCYGHSPQQVFVIRQPGSNIWVRTCRGGTYAGLVVAQEQALEVTSALLPASELEQALAADGRVALEVHFATDEADILPASMPQIEQVVELLRSSPELALSIEGHTDSTGNAARNLELSKARAASVVAAITAAGIDAGRLEAAGFGDTRPVADNATDDGRARNRRVELVRRG